jgi:uncharacterized membrane protein
MTSLWHKVLPIITLLVALCLLCLRLSDKSLWVDELFTAELAGHSATQIVADVSGDLHPPLYFWVVRGWSALAGTSEVALRLPSVFAALLGLWFTWQLGVRIVGRLAAQVSMIALAFSPLFVEFSRMARYYSWVLALGTLATLMFVNALQHGRWRDWAAYGLIVTLGLFTSYLSATLVLAHGLAVVFDRQAARSQGGKWLLSVIIVGAVFTPWLPVVARQVHNAGGGSADYARSLTGLVASLAYPFYAFSVGETLFPWFPIAVPAAVAVLGLVAWAIYKPLGRWRTLMALVGVLPILLTALITTFVSTGTPFFDVPVRALFVLPYLTLAMGAGWQAMSRPIWRIALVGLVGAAWTTSLVNHYTGRQYLNPIYIVPARQVAEQIATQAGAEDVVIGEWDSGLSHYYKLAGGQAPYFEATQARDAIDFISTHSVSQVWLVTMGRDGTRELIPLDLMRWLEANYRLTSEQGYVEQAPVYRQVKERLLHRSAYRFKLLVQKYERPP